ncbi:MULTISPECIES: metal ABC transporter permease [Helcococcus]|uniref:Metal ABC transporter permease n=1 Tax=Helcococcus bovis TaxID=3153252 RepID=A0ABW9F7Q1_9FIRM
MFEFDFMRRALLAGLMLSIMIPLIGVVMVNRKTSMIGDALSHTSLMGVALGLILSINPAIGAVVIAVLSAFAIEIIRKKFPQYGDMATAVIMSLGLGLAAILSDFAPGGNTFESYLFGSISAVTKTDLIFISIVFLFIVLISIIYYGALLDISINPNLARLSGVKVKFINFIFTLFSAITIALAAKVIGALMVASLIVLPVATALFIARSYKQSLILSVFLGVIYMMLGLTISFYYDIRPGGSIVVIAILGMLVVGIISKCRKLKK